MKDFDFALNGWRHLAQVHAKFAWRQILQREKFGNLEDLQDQQRM